jgi:outer membrane biogenesis lipoprotein LolB
MDLKNTLQWLRGSDESQWNDVTRLLSETVAQLQDAVQQAKDHKTMDRRAAESDAFSREATAINVAMPQLTKMLDAMKDHNREAALEHGQGALALLPHE